MLGFLKNHPFAVKATFEKTVVLTFAVEKEQLEKLIPESLTLDTFDNKYGFIAVALVKTKNLRPSFYPKFMGNDFFLIGYRVFVRYKNTKDKNLRGLYILKSETDKKKMEFLGNLFTHYNYTTTDINYSFSDKIKEIFSVKSKFKFRFAFDETEQHLPENSPFTDWKEARRFVGPLPFTFTYNKQEKSVLIIEGVRENWKPKPIKVLDYHFDFLEQLPIKNPVLANAVEFTNIPYSWKKGKKELWKP